MVHKVQTMVKPRPIDAEKRRMVERHLAARGIDDPAVLAAMEAVPREAFVTPEQLRDAYADRPLSIEAGQTISQPYIVAFMAQELRLSHGDRVLDVGTGSGYAAAVLAEITGQVFSIERIDSLAHKAIETLMALGYDDRVQVVTGDGTKGWPEAAPFDAICVAAAAATIPPELLAQLADGARLVIPVADGSDQDLVVMERHGDSFFRRRIGAVRFVPLIES